ncbi:DNA-binding CsgD family transcriptional regulator [Streptomyces sp. PvR006]|uniref:helix-turn-helix transcriptional regulator n=1 Tax=Streptomyces sp. PvR006 TaxID=2817860 RepID=UPI001AE89361|nr:helix-turn-helix transcriptional regulator [Streptomyces sp. PvR006]MBP2587167.1 DNA-binding CsgD family transcriptional regulator [Streptomyces sp. PvR006]
MSAAADNMLAVLGVSKDEEAVYRATLRSPGIAVAGIAVTCGMDQESAGAAIGRLSELGMVGTADGRTYDGADPVTVVDRLARRRIHGLQGEIRRVAMSRHMVESLAGDQPARKSRRAAELQLVEGLDEVVSYVDELSFFAREERLTTHPGPILAAALDAVRSSDLKYLRRGLRMRTIVHHSALGSPGVEDFVTELADQGAQVRCTTGPLERMVIFDRRTALVATDPADITRGALVVRHPGLVSQLLTLFESHWSRSSGLMDSWPNSTEFHVLRTMARVDKDEAGARELGMSLRTYRAHVATLMRRLGAPNRFRAALAARERNWL